MRKLLLTLLFLPILNNLLAKEGMWLPFLLEKMNEKDMKSMGMKITAKDIYDENKSSLKDAICIFGSGCTGEVVSKAGLVLTNHHCGYGTVNGLSSLEKDYLKNGFFAMNQNEEIPCPGLSVTFIVKIVDVTKAVTTGLKDDLRDETRSKTVAKRIDSLNKANTKDGFGANIKGFFNDNAYYMFITQKFTDIRLVAFPPNSIGKFGGDTDNWAWPRHTGDFSMFRIYVDKNNKAAAYNKNNIAYNPKRFLKINIAGIKEGDFTMVYGFPGRTQQNLTSGGVSEVMNVLDPARIKIRQARLNIMDEDMRNDRSVFLKYAGKQAGIANAFKKWQGELLGLGINDGVNKKLLQEQNYNQWVNKPENNSLNTNIVNDINSVYTKQKEQALLNVYMDEAFGGCEFLQQANTIDEMIEQLEKTKNVDSIQKYKTNFTAFYKGYNVSTDRKNSIKMMELLKLQFPDLALEGYKNMEAVFDESIITNEQKMMALFDTKDADALIILLKNDKAYQQFLALSGIQSANFNTYRVNQMELIALHHTYTQQKLKWPAYLTKYPDANSTLRVGYGKVEGLKPRDGMSYSFYTTLDGAIAKENKDIEEFEVPEKLKTLWLNKDYGQYAMKNGQIPLAFLASNHSTGGNSGSPVLNAKGELIGTNFDRIWEGTMSDILYDINLCRNITLDVRYTLFIIDKFGGASWLLKEMDIVKK